MRFAFFTALRYLFGRSRLGATGWISLVSSIAIMVVTVALVCVMSVYNGYVAMLLEGESRNYPELMIRPRKGDKVYLDKLEGILKDTGLIHTYSPLLLTQGVLRSPKAELFADVCGIDNRYTQVVSIDSGLLEGSFAPLGAYRRAIDTIPMVLGIALAAEGATSNEPDEEDQLRLTVPRREGLINPLAPASAFIDQPVSVVGVLSAMNEHSNRIAYMPIEAVRDLLSYDANIASAIAVKVNHAMSVTEAKERLTVTLGKEYVVLNREEQQPELTSLIKTERVMVYLIMLAILTLAAFNLASSLVMLIYEKELDLRTLYMLGASPTQSAGIFAFTGLLISGIGVLVGLSLGLTLSVLQQHWGFLYSGEGINRLPFPIDIQFVDLVYILLATSLISFVSAGLPASLLWKNTIRTTKQ